MNRHALRKSLIWMLALVMMLSLFGCGGSSKNNEKKVEEAARSYCEKLADQTTDVFGELAETATGEEAGNINGKFAHASLEFLQAEVKPLQEILEAGDPVIMIGIPKEAGKWSEEEIRDIILEAKNRNYIVDLYFDGDDFHVYQVRADGVKLDITTPKDGGAMHELEEYEL